MGRSQFIQEADAEKMIRLYQEGLSLNEVAAKIRCSNTTVRNVLVANGIARRPKGRHDATVVAQVAEKPENPDKAIVDLYNEGYTIKDIASMAHRATVTVLAILHNAGIDTSLRSVTHKAKSQPTYTARERYYQRIADLGDWRNLSPEASALRHEKILEIETQYRFEQLLEAADIALDDTRDYDEDLELLLHWITAHKG